MKKTIEEIAKEDGRYDVGALKFVHDGLGRIILQNKEVYGDETGPHHISGAELAKGLAELAIERWGRLGKMVLNQWGIQTTRDFGEIVYLMICNQWMTAQESDQIEDFDNIYDFETIFEKQFQFDMK